jgi:hypothetical protein
MATPWALVVKMRLTTVKRVVDALVCSGALWVRVAVLAWTVGGLTVIEFRVLGSLEVVDGDRPLALLLIA